MKKAIALSFMLALLLAFLAGGVSCREVPCSDKIDMSLVGGPYKECRPDICKELCESKYGMQVYRTTCLDLKTCLCDHYC